jgi:ADP-ribose pyrophosphatase
VGFTVLGDTARASGYAFEFVDRLVEAPDGSTFTRNLIKHVGAVAVLPVASDGTVHLLRQYRSSFDRFILEMPAGLRDVDDEDLEDAARRELEEEVGLRADELVYLGCVANSSGFTDQRTWLYLGLGLHDVDAAPEGIEEHFIERCTMPLSTLLHYEDPEGSDVTLLLAAHLAQQYLASRGG